VLPSTHQLPHKRGSQYPREEFIATADEPKKVKDFFGRGLHSSLNHFVYISRHIGGRQHCARYSFRFCTDAELLNQDLFDHRTGGRRFGNVVGDVAPFEEIGTTSAGN
jgi:hypothetical protein